MRRFALIATLFATSAQAAEVGFGLTTGVRSLEMGLMLDNAKYQEARGAEAGADAYVTPGKSVPLALCLGASRQSYGLNKDRHYFDHLEVTEVSGGIALIPVGAKTRPVIKLMYTFFGNAVATTSGDSAGEVKGVDVAQTGESTWKMGVSGLHFNVGTQLELGKGALLGLSLDFAQTRGTLKSVELGRTDRTDDVKDAGLSKMRMKSTAVLIGGDVAL